MKKCLVGLLMMGSLLSLTFLTGCNNKEVITTDKSTSSQQSVTSDVNVEEQQGNNIKLEFSDDNFAVNMTLPNEWSTKLREDLSTEWVKFPLMNLESQYNIYDENNNCIGAIGYSEYTPQKDVEELPQAIYSGVAVPNNYNFNARTVDEGDSIFLLRILIVEQQLLQRYIMRLISVKMSDMAERKFIIKVYFLIIKTCLCILPWNSMTMLFLKKN